MFKKIFVLFLSFIILPVNYAFAHSIAKDTKAMTREDICKENFEMLFKTKWQENSGNDAEFMDILQKYIFGEIFTIGDLDNKTRELITVTSLSVQQTLPQLKAHINGALNAGASPVEIREAIYQCAPFIGFPKTLNAISVFNEVLAERKIETPLKKTGTVQEEERYKRGFEIQNPIYENEIKDALSGLPKNMGDDVSRFLTEVCFGDFYTREGLDIKTRELLVIAILTTTGNKDVLKSHIKGALKTGNSIETITAAIIQCLPYVGFPNIIASLKVIKEISY